MNTGQNRKEIYFKTMGRLGDMMRSMYGTPEQKEKIKQIENSELSDKVKGYFARLRQEIEFYEPTYYEVLNAFQKEYKRQNGRYYEGVDIDLVENMALYFAKDSSFNLRGQKYSLKKGLLLKGGYGVGKTSIFKAFRELKPVVNFGIKSTIEIVKMFDEGGVSVIETYSKIGEMCFDDLGTEKDGKHYGNTQNTFKDIMELRYNRFKQLGTRTHVSTNLDANQFKERYGERMESRLYEMFNILIFKGTDYRKNL